MARPISSQTAAVAGMLAEPGGIERIRLAWRLVRDERVTPLVKLAVPAVVLLYLLSPVDLIPDFLLGIGQVDDLGLLAMSLAILVRALPRLAPEAVVEEHLADIRGQAFDSRGTSRGSRTAERVYDAEFRVNQ